MVEHTCNTSGNSTWYNVKINNWIKFSPKWRGLEDPEYAAGMSLAIQTGVDIQALPPPPRCLLPSTLILHLSHTQSLSYICFLHFWQDLAADTYIHIYVCYGHTHTHTYMHTHTHTHYTHKISHSTQMHQVSWMTFSQPQWWKTEAPNSLWNGSVITIWLFLYSNFPLLLIFFKSTNEKMKNSFQINLRLPTKWKQKRPYTISYVIIVYLSRP